MTEPRAPEAGGNLAGLWLDCYERLAAAAAHEVNNALNGVAMNLEVVRLRATAGADAGRVAPFAAASAEEHAATVALVGALVALGRAPRAAGTVDVTEVVGHAAVLFAPLLRHRGVTLLVENESEGRTPTAAPARAVRLAVCATLEGAWTAASDATGSDPSRVLRCTVQATDRPILAVVPAPAAWDDGARAALAAAGVLATRAPDGLRVAFPKA